MRTRPRTEQDSDTCQHVHPDGSHCRKVSYGGHRDRVLCEEHLHLSIRLEWQEYGADGDDCYGDADFTEDIDETAEDDSF
jgi:hypothetical protein